MRFDQLTQNPMFSLLNKNALVTGAGSGIGRAIAETFAGAKALVWVVDRDEAAAKITVDLIRRAGGTAEAATLDVSDEVSSSELAKRLPVIDVLVNNAGIGHVGSLLSTSASDLDRLHAVNVRGTFNICRAFVPGMLERKRGSVINVASIGGILGIRDRLAYCASKFAVVGLTKALALDYSHTGVRFNAICPGRVETPFVSLRLAESANPEKTRQEMCATQLTGRMAHPSEIAAAVLYLASDESAMVTGSTLAIDGGWSAGK
ncbi:MAG: 2-keto-3-deoxy-L-fuconate dehydrogenase [Verrucomicrobiales bacterium]|nr:2-keto-3-deoxy-L-fuconate dehydrogenase [Verrucomicrobiales bacterium]